MDSEEKKELISLSKNDPKKSTQRLWHLNPKKISSTSSMRKILISYGEKLTRQKSWANEHALLPELFLAKCAVFGRNDSGTAP